MAVPVYGTRIPGTEETLLMSRELWGLGEPSSSQGPAVFITLHRVKFLRQMSGVWCELWWLLIFSLSYTSSYTIYKLHLHLHAIQGMPKTQSSMEDKSKLQLLSRYRIILLLRRTIKVTSSCYGDIA